VYSEAAPAWIAAGIAAFPLGGADGKKPLIRNPGRIGRRAALDLSKRPQFAGATGLGFWCGPHNGVTVVDIDSAADAELQYAIDAYGDSPVIVRTASGKSHIYYRHSGERRRIRPDKGHPIDILGEGGLAVAPPSERPAGGRYGFLRGGLEDLRRLPEIKAGAIAEPARARGHHAVEQRAPAAKAELGMRNATMFRLACEMATKTADNVELLDLVRVANADLPVPLPDDEVARLVGSVSAYRDTGRLMVPGLAESTLILPASIADHVMATGNLDVAGLMMLVRKYHSEPGKTFALSASAMAEANKINGWARNRYRNAIRDAVNLGLLVLVHAGGRGARDPSLYKITSVPRGL
jgi:hypothetical protein